MVCRFMSCLSSKAECCAAGSAARNNRYQLTIAIRISIAVASAVDYAHRHGLVHR
jgi:hypothetical protein